MRVLVVTPHFLPTHVGGVERYAKMQAEWLTRHGHEVEVVCVERLSEGVDSATATVERVDGYRVHRVILGFAAERDFRLRWDHEAFREWFVRLLEDLRPDVMHVQSGYLVGAPALSAARELGVPAIITLHDYWFICPRITLLQPSGAPCTGPDDAAKCGWCLQTERRRFRLADRVTRGAAGLVGRALMRRSLSGSQLVKDVARRFAGLGSLLDDADLVLSPSEFLRGQMVHAGAAADRIHVEPSGIKPAREQKRLSSATLPLRLGYVGRVVEPKGIHVLIEAAARLPFDDWQMTIHGPSDIDPRYTTRLRRLIGGDSRIRFEGPFATERLDQIFENLDVLVIPSIWYENRPLVILEALSAGMSVVASRLGGMAELITHERNGLLFRPGDPEDLARQLARFRSEPDLVDRLRAGGDSVRSHDEEMASLLAAYQRVIR